MYWSKVIRHSIALAGASAIPDRPDGGVRRLERRPRSRSVSRRVRHPGFVMMVHCHLSERLYSESADVEIDHDQLHRPGALTPIIELADCAAEIPDEAPCTGCSRSLPLEGRSLRAVVPAELDPRGC